MDETIYTSLTTALWADGPHPGGQQVYCLLDGARDPQIAPLVRSGDLDFECLFAGELHPRLEAAAPYLVHLTPDSTTTSQLLELGWGEAWGIFALAPPEVTLAQLRTHFKKFLRVKTEAGKELAFRFYDPRVLNVYLPTCTPDEFATFMGPVASLCAEQADGAHIGMFDIEDGAVVVRATPLT